MTEGFYTDPKNPQVLAKVACVIPFIFHTRDYGHYKEDKKKTLIENLECHKHYQAGVDYDIILVNHGGPVEGFESYTVLDEPNEGFSFGGWKQAWERFRDQYSFYLFCEDDMAPAKNNWLSQLILKFLSDKNIGAVGNFVEGRSSEENFSKMLWEIYNYDRPMMYNFDGSYTFTSSKILRQVERIGGLPVLPCEPNHRMSATVNECLFQQPILELGYKIVSFDGFVVHGSELFTGDVGRPEGEMPPLLNLNGRIKIPRVRDNFSWLESSQE